MRLPRAVSRLSLLSLALLLVASPAPGDGDEAPAPSGKEVTIAGARPVAVRVREVTKQSVKAAQRAKSAKGFVLDGFETKVETEREVEEEADFFVKASPRAAGIVVLRARNEGSKALTVRAIRREGSDTPPSKVVVTLPVLLEVDADDDTSVVELDVSGVAEEASVVLAFESERGTAFRVRLVAAPAARG